MSYRRDDIHSMMTDPTIANARIYVGNIPTNDMTKHDLEERFEKHGTIMGISLNRGFGFVQYEHESRAREAIKQENGAMFRGTRMEVNAARVFGGGRGRGDGGPTRNPSGDTDERGDSYRDRSPLDDRRGGDRGDWRDRYDSFPSSAAKERSMYYRGGESEFSSQDKFHSGPLSDDRAGNSFGKDPFGASFRPSLGDTRGSVAPSRDYPGTGSVPRDYSGASNTVAPLDRTNDCEIIVFNKNQRDYAEYIERRLKQLGLSVDILFPNEEVPISRILANISSRGTLYAIVVMPQNEEHRSLTLNILHGLPQEHRNMPLEDAVPLIKRNFDAYIRGEKLAGVSLPPVVPAALTERHPDAMQALLNLLLENRPLTVLQYDRIIQYLQDKRELQLKLELGDAKDFVPIKEPASKQQVDLQHRILNILNNQAPAPTPVAPPAGNWQQQSQSSTPLLNDPNVQKALDSLMQGNLLRKIAPGAGNQNPNSTSVSQLGTPPSQPLFGSWGGSGKML